MNQNNTNETKEHNCVKGYDLGFTDAYKIGLEDGWAVGYDEGFREGWVESRAAMEEQ
jgi:hypothetical protein